MKAKEYVEKYLKNLDGLQSADVSLRFITAFRALRDECNEATNKIFTENSKLAKIREYDRKWRSIVSQAKAGMARGFASDQVDVAKLADFFKIQLQAGQPELHDKVYTIQPTAVRSDYASNAGSRYTNPR